MRAPGWLNTLFRRDRGRSVPSPGHPDGTASTLGRVPFHVAIIMDGNGRWAERRHLPVAAGHRAGGQAVRTIVEMARDVGLGQLTLYSFSTENWSRSREEVATLMRLHVEMIQSEVPTLHKNDCRVLFVGRRHELEDRLREKMEWAEDLTKDNKRMILFIALNYGGRREILDAVRSALADGVPLDDLSEADVSHHLYSPLMKDPDLVIRTSGEKRLSNFLLWQAAYSEFYFTDTLWPDFGRQEFQEALDDYAARDRRFGGRGKKAAAALPPHRSGEAASGAADEAAITASDEAAGDA